ncbi:MAG: DUF1080 domain-containing protein, partial [Thermoguttaceae bacterium]|nr:DUF1080 domain-containing protein [Thermoguttaceae bacterium]
TLNGWAKHGGAANYKVEDGAIVGTCVPNTPNNTFLVYEKEFGNFILKLDFKVAVPGNSGVQFRSHIRKDDDRVFGYQCEISGDPDNARIYDEGRRGHQKGRVWLDNTSDDVRKAAFETYKAGEWNTLEIQAIGPSIRTWINGVAVTNIFDVADMSGVFGLQVHAGSQGTICWKNIRVKDLGVSEWKDFFVKENGEWKTVDCYYFTESCWAFNQEEGYLVGTHEPQEVKDGLVVTNDNYDDFAARVTYWFRGGANSALYFRAHEVDTTWLLRGCQDEIAGNGKDAAIWHTAGKSEPGRGWLGADDAFVETIRNKEGWNDIAVVACGDRATTFLNGFRVVDLNDPQLEKTGKLGLQLHGGADGTMWFKGFQVLPITKEQRALIER